MSRLFAFIFLSPIFLSKPPLGMPVAIEADLRRPSRKELGAIAYDVMQVVFAVHNELGRFLDEQIYQQEIAHRLPVTRTELPIRVKFDDFTKMYFLDLLVANAAAFELKAVEHLAGRHPAQLINYLLLTELPHGKLVNLRPDTVEHEFANSTLRRSDRIGFEVSADGWDSSLTGVRDVRRWLVAALRDWGTGLDLHLYEEACSHFVGRAENILGDTEILVDGRRLGLQMVRFAAPGVALKITAITPEAWPQFEDDAHRFLTHSSLDSIAWINITLRHVRFTTIRRTSDRKMK
ncbi:MAG TPA: GxxExxY protein [Pirellulales bacterium]|jgi:GxxExxY protein|nr:GxxExxY protein [Pirellulales bacterium]